MMIRRNNRESRSETSIQLSEIDSGVRQCPQALWSCEAVREKGAVEARQHWMKLAERAWRDFEEDKQFGCSADN